MNRITALIISLGIFLFTILSIFPFESKSSSAPEADDGQLDLHLWDFEEKGKVELNGEWTFYPDELIDPHPDQDMFSEYRHLGKKMLVPSSWEVDRWRDKSEYVVGTYRLIIQVPKDGLYGVKTNTIRYASRLFINGKEVGSSGVPAKEREHFKAYNRKYIGLGESKEGQLEIVVQVANHRYPTGGIIHPLEFGTGEQIQLAKDQERAIDALLVSGYLLLGLYYFVSFFLHTSSVYQLFFSLFCLLQGIYLATLNEKLIELIFPVMEISILTNIQFALIHSSIFFFLAFIYESFKEYASKRVTNVLSFLIMIDGLLYGIPNVSKMLLSNLPLTLVQAQIVIVLSFASIYTILILIKAFMKETEGSQYILVIVTTFFNYGFLLGIDLLFEVDIGRVPVFLFLLMTVSLSLLMGHRFHHTFIQVEQLSKDLRTYDHLKDEFLAKTSHELRTPLNGILNLSKSLMEGKEGPLRLKQQESVALIHNVGKRLATIVEDLLYASKIKKEEINVSAKAVHVKVIDEVLAEMQLLKPPSEKIKIINKVNSDLPYIYVDEQRFKQILYNLLSNAIKYTEQGEITISAEVQDKYMYISVCDTGVGMSSDDLQHIFSFFYQAEDHLRRGAEGLGLGLAITKQLVEAVEGEISVTSELKKGSCFTFSLPLATKEQLSELESGQSLMTNNGDDRLTRNKQLDLNVKLNLPLTVEGDRGYTILVVDDEHANLKVLVNLIGGLRYTVIAVDDGRKALALLKNIKVDLLILDLMMPKMSGYEVCQFVREEYHMVELPILILTAAGQLSDLILSFDIGANDFLRKPVQQEELKARIESLLSMKKSAQEAIHNELSYFYAQITPHFLFNTFNTIIGLSYIDEEKTREALEHLSTYFRAKLDFYKQDSLISINKEIELVKSYLSIQQMRYGDRLRVHYHIDESIEVMLPSMTIQPLVENAVQHGITKKISGGDLWLSIQRSCDGVKIVVKDNGVGMTEEKRANLLKENTIGIGFKNTFKKLKLIKKAKLFLESREGEGTEITIILPEVKSNESGFN
ncbi:response regulator [Bacillus aquiflavi]|uniref:ATP-binding protein n=1 Tax=Bacillus aquiflavi TaxID=2672567 RepID=UPI001CA81A68|nr:ATP-binding protein [Bacillus aquiflavi]UAC48569.1 response regulator [Bacillus aquiflavi]